MIIDSHTHLSGPPFNEETLYTTYPDGGGFDMGIERAACHIDLLLEDMEERGVDRALVMGFPEMITNEQLSDLVMKHPDKITGFAGVRDPKSEDAIQELDHSVKELGLRGLKLHPDCHSFSPSDREIVPLIRRAAELDVPTLIHSYPGGMRRGYFGTAAPDTIDDLKAQVPEATIIIGHMGYPRYLDLLTVAQIPGVFVETSWGLTSIAELHGLGFTARFLRMIGVDNVLFGSDWIGKQLGVEQEKQLDLINKLDLTREEREKILGGNISKILKI